MRDDALPDDAVSLPSKQLSGSRAVNPNTFSPTSPSLWTAGSDYR
jgi:hypothetical protein